MNWTEFLQQEIETAYATTALLLNRVDEAQLDWKPQSGNNWMTVGQLLRHLTEACGAGCRAMVTGDWGLPDGRRYEDLAPEEMIPQLRSCPRLQAWKRPAPCWNAIGQRR